MSNIIKIVLGFLGLTPLKGVVIAVVISLLSGLYFWAGQKFDDHYEAGKAEGFADCVALHQQASNKEAEKQLQLLRGEIERLHKKRQKDRAVIEKAKNTINNLEQKHRDLDYEIDNFEPVNNCADLGPEFMRLYNAALGELPAS